LFWMHARLFREFLLRLPWLAWRRACKDRRTDLEALRGLG
jgi:hypothetical protein